MMRLKSMASVLLLVSAWATAGCQSQVADGGAWRRLMILTAYTSPELLEEAFYDARYYCGPSPVDALRDELRRRATTMRDR